MLHSLRPAFHLVIGAVLLTQFMTAPHIYARAAGTSGSAPATPGMIVQQQAVLAGGRTVLTVVTSGVVEVVVFEHTGDRDLLRVFRTGQTPRTAKVFTNIRELRYPLVSEGGSDFFVRVRPLVAGKVTILFEPGTIARAMAQLRNGTNLVRNRGTVVVHGGLHAMPVYQLVPATVIRVVIVNGRGTVALLKTRDYLAVRNGATLARLCSTGSCLRTASRGNVLELRIDDYDDRYLAAVSDGVPFTFSYQVIATPGTLNYITTCL